MNARLTRCVVAGLGLLLSAPAMADREAVQAKEEVYQMMNVPSMIRQAADNVARRYNLNADQTSYTRKMMEERVNKFLSEQEEVIWPLVRDLARHQLSGQPLDAELAKRIGEAALPIVEKAKSAIFEGNAEWSEILTEEQKRLHEYDLREMQSQFELINKNFEDYKKGDTQPKPIFGPEYQPKPDEPPRPPQPPRVFKPEKDEDRWGKYVEDFIRKYELDPAQVESAESTLREMRQRAADYRTSKADDFKTVEKRINEAVAKGDLKKRMAAIRDEKALNKPIQEMFTELKGRLDKIPQAAQKRNVREGKANRASSSAGAESRAKTSSKAKKPPASDDS